MILKIESMDGVLKQVQSLILNDYSVKVTPVYEDSCFKRIKTFELVIEPTLRKED